MKRRIIQQFPRIALYNHVNLRNALLVSRRSLSTAHNRVPSSTTNMSPTTLESDFFGEPVTFVHPYNANIDTKHQQQKTTNAMEALDGFLLTVVSKGKSCIGGGDEAGLDVQPAHATSLSWAELLRHAAVWNPRTVDSSINHHHDNRSSPMLVVVAVAPLLAQTGAAYVQHLDTLLRQASPGVKGLPVIQMLDLATSVVQKWQEYDHHRQRRVKKKETRDDDDDNNNRDTSQLPLTPPWNERECLHIKALSYLLHDKHSQALSVMLKILQRCPGDLLALSIAMDLAQTTGSKRSALRAAGSVAAYWSERAGGFLTPALTGHALATSWMALGLAVGGRTESAEQLAERSMKQGRKLGGAIATWAQAHIFDAAGRVSEGISAMSNFDGIVNYEGAGWMFFDCRLAGYGARFSLDREERGRGTSRALRLYERNFDRVLDYSGFAMGRPWTRPQQPAPIAWKDETTLSLEQGDSSNPQESLSFWERISGKHHPVESQKKEYYELVLKGEDLPSSKLENWDPSLEDVLTWLPPTPQLLSDATLLLLRLTLNGTISTQNGRWGHMRNAWRALLEMQNKSGKSLSFCPLAALSASLLCHPRETGGDGIGNGRLAQALYGMGETLRLGGTTDQSPPLSKSTALREIIADRDPNFWLPVEGETNDVWKEIVDHFSSGLDGFVDLHDNDTINELLLLNSFEHWDFEARPILEHAVVFAACKAGDIESLSLARAICSQGVTIRTNSPEEWWRYSIVLGLLGDERGSEDALQHSINFGSGQGSRSVSSL